MKIQEEISRIHKIMGISDDKLVISEASKIDILINKLGLTKENAEKVQQICGGLSVLMVNKIKDLVKESLQPKVDNEFLKKQLNMTIRNGRLDSSLISIMDYIRVGLDGNFSTLKNLTFTEINEKSHEWHESLEIGGGKINYEEKSPILIDFRDENGEGFYWADLETQNSQEECNRMGHCGRSSYGYLYSLRSDKYLPGNKYKINKSHVTAAIGKDGTMFQMKGAKNTKPKEEYHKYILPLFYLKEDNDDYFIQEFGSEYASHQDFKISDLGNDIIIKLYKNRPELFENRQLRRKLIELGIIEKPKIDYIITKKIEPDSIGEYVDGDYVIRTRKYKAKTPAGVEYEKTQEISLFETILSGDSWELWDNWEADWKSALEYYINKENENKIKEILKPNAISEDFTEEDFENAEIEDLIEEFDVDYDIQRAISSAVNDAESSDYMNHLYNELKNNLKEYGEIKQMDDTGVVLEIDVEKFIKDIDYPYLDDYMERCNDNIECLFSEILYGGTIEKPKFYVDDRWYPDVNEQYFNEDLSWRLEDI